MKNADSRKKKEENKKMEKKDLEKIEAMQEIIATHDERILNIADKVYQVENYKLIV